MVQEEGEHRGKRKGGKQNDHTAWLCAHTFTARTVDDDVRIRIEFYRLARTTCVGHNVRDDGNGNALMVSLRPYMLDYHIPALLYSFLFRTVLKIRKGSYWCEVMILHIAQDTPNTKTHKSARCLNRESITKVG